MVRYIPAADHSDFLGINSDRGNRGTVVTVQVIFFLFTSKILGGGSRGGEVLAELGV